MTIYGPVAYCHVCNVSVPTSELELPNNFIYTKPEETNIKDKMDYIASLPTKIIRGLQLPYDDQGYYIIWPSHNFYKKRLYSGKSRYIGPSGHKVPLFICPGTENHLVVVEGEINAASLYSVIWEGYKISSPGSAGELLRHINYYLGYKKVTLYVDNDAAGIAHGYQVKEVLLKHKKHVNLVLLDKDFNDILQKDPEELRRFFERTV